MACKSNEWYRKVFGDSLIRCEGLASGNANVQAEKHESTDVIFENFDRVCQKNDCELVIGVYFSLFDSDPDESAKRLVRLYHSINGVSRRSESKTNPLVTDVLVDAFNRKIYFEVIHVFFSKSFYPRDENTEGNSEIRNHSKEFPWYAVPVEDTVRMIKLTKRYQIKSPTQSLILLNGKTGQIITKHGRDRLFEDPEGTSFPWQPRPLNDVLRNVELERGQTTDSFSPINFQALKGFVVGFYFSAYWCPPCKGFTPQLVKTYDSLKRKGVNFEIIFVSWDRSGESQKTYLKTMPWLAVPYSELACRKELASLFGVQGIPTLVIVDSDGTVITCDGRGEINDDPTGQMFPWRPKLVNILTERHSAKLQDSPAVVLFLEKDETEIKFAESILLSSAKYFVEKHQNEEVHLEFFLACDNETCDRLREFVGIDDAVPLLTLINIPDGTWAALDDKTDIDEETVKMFVSQFLSNSLLMQPIGDHDQKMIEAGK